MKNFMVTHTLKSEEAMDAYFQALETMSEADIRGAMKNEKASFQMQWNAGKTDKVMFCWWKAESAEAMLRLWATWRNCLIMISERCQMFMISKIDCQT